MSKNLFAALSLSLAFGFGNVSANAQEVQTVLIDGEAIPVSSGVVETINALDAEATAAQAASSATSPEETKSIVDKIAKVVNYRSSLNAAVERALDNQPVGMKLSAFATTELFEVGVCSQIVGNDAGNCAYHQGLNLGRKYIQDLTINRFVDNKFKGKTGKKNAIAKFILKQAGSQALKFGQSSLESSLGIKETNSLLQGHLLGTIDGVAYTALKSTGGLPGARP